MDNRRNIQNSISSVARNSGVSEHSDLVCFSHLRWDFVFQRPQHLLTRAAKTRRVFFIEEPVFETENSSGNLLPFNDITSRSSGVQVVQPHLKSGMNESEIRSDLKALTDALIQDRGITDFTAWYYTPSALKFSDHLEPNVTIYDCMDELSLFKHAPKELREMEKELFRRADLVYTGGPSLYEAKKKEHPHVFAFPSSIDFEHFAKARNRVSDTRNEPQDQANIPHPRIGFFGVLDERLDTALVDGIAEARPDWHIVLIGPLAKIEQSDLPNRPNIHCLGPKNYQDLPEYIAGWDVAMMPFAHNDSTRFISPTKTPEYLAAGKPVISTSIKDVVRPYGEKGLVYIADTVAEFIVAAAEAGMDENWPAESSERGTQPYEDWLSHVDTFLATMSWDKTWEEMDQLISLAKAGALDSLQPKERTIAIQGQRRSRDLIDAEGEAA